ncbi:ParB/RepB/Spo0J family partition protein [Thalassoglobus sp.]|uniref:ParB/RepB/Spo0J family partition protein n=1 Tax=Thalassoglobus sp. TaxID=2795869 RepID=UPI003AA88B34
MSNTHSKINRKSSSGLSNGESVRALSEIRPSPENDKLYRPINPDDPEIIALANSIKKHGLLQPIVVTRDGFIISGHRRFAACNLAGLATVSVQTVNVYRQHDINRFTVLLREHNRQRDKSNAEKLREEVLQVNPTVAYQTLISHRQEIANVDVDEIVLGECRKRSKISKAKREFRDAIYDVVYQYREHWPLTDRRIHYFLLNNPPMKNTVGKNRARYQNDQHSYDNLTDMLTRMRLNGDIPFKCIADETRPVETWNCYSSARPFFRGQLDEFCLNYWRDLMQSQPNHVELLAEKNTVFPTVKSVAMKYCIPVTSGRGHSSLDPRHQIYQRFKKSGKENLILIIVSDFDPAGECIAESFSRSMRDDFGIEGIIPVKAALTHEQVSTLSLTVDGLTPKKNDKQRKVFEEKYGADQKCFELEAIEPEALSKIITETIDSVIDQDAFNNELDNEKQDAATLEMVRKQAVYQLQDLLNDI